MRRFLVYSPEREAHGRRLREAQQEKVRQKPWIAEAVKREIGD